VRVCAVGTVGEGFKIWGYFKFDLMILVVW
jgi:hypothetical protein